ncbi:MAG: flagellar filament outer layer protein FlaA [Treponema sp.]|nr:flagellar filament outer layer protein FlaA [Treponema sp.]
MKHGSFRAMCLILLACIAVVSAFGDEYMLDLQATILETFDQTDESLYDWRFDASKFATKTDEETFPKVSYVSVWPASVFGSNPEGEELKSLGIWGRFDRRGYNWIDIYPVLAADGDEAGPTEIPIPGRVQYLDMWVWGSNLRYDLEAYVRDYQGVIHTVKMGNLAFQGWKNLRASVPRSISQAKRILPAKQSLTFVKFRIWTQPQEQVNNFYIYFDQFRVVSDMFESIYDGKELADPARVQELWNGEEAAE